MLLFKGYAIDIFIFEGRRFVGRVHLDHEIVSLALGLEDFERLGRIGGRNDAVRYLTGQEGGRLLVTFIGKGDKIAVGGHAVRTAGADVGSGNRGQFDALDEIDFFE